MKRKLLLFIIFILSTKLFSIDWSKIESYELQPIQFNQEVKIISEKVTINNNKTKIEIELSPSNKQQKEVDCILFCEPRGYGKSYTDMLIPYDFNISFNNQQTEFYVINDNQKYTSNEAENHKGYKSSEIHFKLKLNKKNNKLELQYYNYSIIGFLKYGYSSLILNYRFINQTSKKEVLYYNNPNSKTLFKVLVYKSPNIANNSNLLRKNTDSFTQWQYELSVETQMVEFILEEYDIDMFPEIVTTFSVSYFNEEINNNLLKIKNLFFLSKEQLAILRNSIYASHGYDFKNPKWKEYFTTNFNEYKINSNFSESDFSEIEKKNIELIKYMENTTDVLQLSDYVDLEEE